MIRQYRAAVRAGRYAEAAEAYPAYVEADNTRTGVIAHALWVLAAIAWGFLTYPLLAQLVHILGA